MKAVVLMSRMSDYMQNCLASWHEASGVDLHIVRMKVNTVEAPFNFAEGLGGLTQYNREDMSDAEISELVKRLRPKLIICFGWFDSAYLSAVKSRMAGTIAVMTMDNQWTRSSRQLLGVVFSRLFLVRHFDFVWVPGPRQRRFAHLLGFSDNKIREGLYVANDDNFTPIYMSIQRSPLKRLVFVGRHVEVKGLRELWLAFESYHAANNSTLELLCIGTGPLYDDRPQHPRIIHLGFVQPREFREKLAGGGIFILPSKFEPWGVVVHEFALAGFPLLLSNAVGAADRFLTTENGRLIATDRPQSLFDAFAFIDKLDSAELHKMSEASRTLGAGLSVANWCAQADEFLMAAPS